MGDMIAIGVVLATFIGLAIITAFIEAETVGYADWLPGWLLHRAAKKLPDGERDRWLEEWLADLNQLPKAPITRLGWALMSSWKSFALARAIRPTQRRLVRRPTWRTLARLSVFNAVGATVVGVGLSVLAITAPERMSTLETWIQVGALLAGAVVSAGYAVWLRRRGGRARDAWLAACAQQERHATG